MNWTHSLSLRSILILYFQIKIYIVRVLNWNTYYPIILYKWINYLACFFAMLIRHPTISSVVCSSGSSYKAVWSHCFTCSISYSLHRPYCFKTWSTRFLNSDLTWILYEIEKFENRRSTCKRQSHRVIWSYTLIKPWDRADQSKYAVCETVWL
jgi:hypothetical protein